MQPRSESVQPKFCIARATAALLAWPCRTPTFSNPCLGKLLLNQRKKAPHSPPGTFLCENKTRHFSPNQPRLNRTQSLLEAPAGGGCGAQQCSLLCCSTKPGCFSPADESGPCSAGTREALHRAGLHWFFLSICLLFSSRDENCLCTWLSSRARQGHGHSSAWCQGVKLTVSSQSQLFPTGCCLWFVGRDFAF